MNSGLLMKGWVRLGTLLVLLAGVLSPVGWSAVAAQSAGVTMGVTPLLGGHVKYGEWLPLRISLNNAGGDLEAEVRTEIAGTAGLAIYAVPVSLPAGARKEVILYVPPPSFAQEFETRLVSGDQVLVSTRFSVITHPQNSYLIGLLTEDPQALQALNALALRQRGLVQAFRLSLADLPERAEALRSLDCLIVNDVDTTALKPAQVEALQVWIAQGGRLVLGGGAGAARTLAGLPEALRPVELAAPTELAALPALADFTGEPVQVPGPFVATLPASLRGHALLRQDGQPLLVQESQGAGWITYLALDPTTSPFDAWAGILLFWQKLLEPGSALPSNTPIDIPQRSLEAEQMSYALQNLPSLAPPSVRWLAILLGIYVLLVGPVNYLLLRRLRRLEWAWLTIPALTLAFSAGAFGAGYRLRGSDLIIHQISVIPLTEGGTVYPVRTYVGLFSPSRESYQVQVDGDPLISPMSVYAPWMNAAPLDTGVGALNVLQGDPALVRGLTVNQWAMQTFEAETLWPAGDQTVETDLYLEGDRLRGTLRNGLDYPLEGIVVLAGNRFVQLGELAAGAERTVDEPLAGSTTGSSIPWALFELPSNMPAPSSASDAERRRMLRQSILESYFHTNWGQPQVPEGLLLLAWTELSPLNVQVAGLLRAAPLQTTLIVKSLPLPVREGSVVLAPGLIPGQITGSQGDGGDCGGGRFYVSRGSVTMEYTLPAQVRGLTPTGLTVLAAPMDVTMNPSLPTIQLYDWAARTWVSVKGITAGVSLPVADPARFVDAATGLVRLQALRDDGIGSCYQLDVGVEGVLP